MAMLNNQRVLFIVDFPIENGGSFHSFLYVYQAGYLSQPTFQMVITENSPFIDGLPIKNGDFPWLC